MVIDSDSYKNVISEEVVIKLNKPEKASNNI